MSALTDTITAALDEAEYLAKNATPGPWTREGTAIVGHPPQGRPNGEIFADVSPSVPRLFPSAQRAQDAMHIVGWSPDVVLRHVKTDRGLLEMADAILDLPHPNQAERGARAVAEAILVGLAASWGVTA